MTVWSNLDRRIHWWRLCLEKKSEDRYRGFTDVTETDNEGNKQFSGPPSAPVTLPIMCKCMYRNSLRTITCNTALKDKVIPYLKQIMFKTFSQV